MRSVISVRKITAFKFPAPRLNFRDDSQWNFWCEISAMIFLRWNFHDEISAMEFPKWNFRGESYAILLQWNFQDEISAIPFPSWNFDCILIKKKHLPWNFPWQNYQQKNFAVKYPTGKFPGGIISTRQSFLRLNFRVPSVSDQLPAQAELKWF